MVFSSLTIPFVVLCILRICLKQSHKARKVWHQPSKNGKVHIPKLFRSFIPTHEEDTNKGKNDKYRKYKKSFIHQLVWLL